MNQQSTVCLEPGDRIRCKSCRLPDAGQSWDCLDIGDVRIFASLDQLEEIAGAINQYLHQQRPPVVAEAVTAINPVMAVPLPGDPFVARWNEEVEREIAANYQVPENE